MTGPDPTTETSTMRNLLALLLVAGVIAALAGGLAAQWPTRAADRIARLVSARLGSDR